MIILIFIAVFASIGFQFAIEPDNILSFYKRFLSKVNKLKVKDVYYGWIIAKPLGYCITCNSHWIGVILIFANYNGSFLLKEFACVAVSGISTLVWFGYMKIREL
jgi:hypothetical protein